MFSNLVYFVLFPVSVGQLLTTSLGSLKGKEYITKDNKTIDCFIGLRYTDPLMRNDRLRIKPMRSQWSGIDSATEFGPACLQSIYNNDSKLYSEDCLYMNIYIDKALRNATDLPILFFIHGGAFMLGSIRYNNFYSFAEYFASRGMIVVEAQYRLSVFGFLALNDTSNFTPNLGLWDIITALNFTRTIAPALGGSLDRITVGGHSAGAMLTSILSVSPVTKDLFNQILEISGSSWAINSRNRITIENTKRLLKRLECPTEPKSAASCIRSKTTEELMSGMYGPEGFSAVVGDSVLPSPPEELLTLASKKRALIGISSLEGLFTSLSVSDSEISKIDRRTAELVLNNTIVNFYPKHLRKAAYLLIFDHYLGETRNDKAYFMHAIARFNVLQLLDIGILREVRHRSRYSETYFYHFEYFNPKQFRPGFPLNKTYHCQEFPYIYNTFSDRQFEFNANDEAVQEFILSSYAQFVHAGDPSTHFQWPTSNSKLKHVVIQPAPLISQELMVDDLKFWDKMRILGYDFIDDTTLF